MALAAAGGAYVPTVFVGMYAPLGVSPSQHFAHAQDRGVIAETEPPRRGGSAPPAESLESIFN